MAKLKFKKNGAFKHHQMIKVYNEMYLKYMSMNMLIENFYKDRRSSVDEVSFLFLQVLK